MTSALRHGTSEDAGHEASPSVGGGDGPHRSELSLSTKLVVVACLLGFFLFLARIGSDFAQRIGATDTEWLTIVWILLGVFAAAGYSLTYSQAGHATSELAAWLTLPLSDRQLILRMTRNHRLIAGVFAVMAIIFGLGFGQEAGFDLGGHAEVVFVPCLVTAFAYPMALLLVRAGRPAAWLVIVAVIVVATLLVAQTATVRPETWRPGAILALVLGASLGWAFIGRLPGRRHLRRLVDRSYEGSGEKSVKGSAARPGPFRSRESAIAALLLQEADPGRRVRRVAWLVPVAVVSTAATWLMAEEVPEVPIWLPAFFAVLMGWWLTQGLPSAAERQEVTEAEDFPARPGVPWRFSIEPLPVAPDEIVRVGLRYRAPLVLALVAAVALFPSLVVHDLELHLISMFIAAVLSLLLIVPSQSELYCVSAERPPPRPIKAHGPVLAAMLALLAPMVALLVRVLYPDSDAWFVVPGRAVESWLIHALSNESVIVWLERISGWMNAVDVRIPAAVIAGGFVGLMTASLRSSLRKRRERTTDIWP